MKKLVYFLPTMLLLPVVASAAATPDISWFNTLFTDINTLIRTILIPLVIGLALLVFIWGVIQYFILGADDEGKRETGRMYMLYAILGLVAIVAVWGIVAIVAEIFGIDTTTTAQGVGGIPTL